MPPVRRPLAGLAALGAAALIAGCGGGSDSSSADDFRQQADEICADANRASTRSPSRPPGPRCCPSSRRG